MNVFISADIEGISGVVLPDHTDYRQGEYERFRRLMTAEINAAVEGALEGGAAGVLVNDSHGRMSNVLLEELNPKAELISGSPKPLGMMQGMGEEADRVFFIGYHASSGTPAAVLEHTSSDRVIGLFLDGRPVGELGMNAALAGAFGKPVALVTGDAAATREAAALLGNVETVAVKEGITRTSARCLNPGVCAARIREAARRALQSAYPVFSIAAPLTLRVVFHRAGHADMAALVPAARRIDGRTVEWTGGDMIAVYRVYRAMLALSAAV